MKPISVGSVEQFPEKNPQYACVANVDLVIVREANVVHVLYGRCLHRGALLADGYVDGQNLICGLHGWDYRLDSGISEYNNEEKLPSFKGWIEDGKVYVDEDEIASWEKKHPQPYHREEYLGLYADIHGTEEEPYVKEIHRLAKNGLSKTGHHGKVAAMGVPLVELPRWKDILIQTAQLKTKPLPENTEVETEFVLGKKAKKPLTMKIPIFISDMSFGALSEEAKVSLARGAEMVGTGICSGEGGMLPEEKAENSRYLFELGSGKFGFSWDKASTVQA
ncbi:MAG: glutamate synthase, partial [Candidatus Hydrogenedentota bacterium]